jgi:hypothetical protein
LSQKGLTIGPVQNFPHHGELLYGESYDRFRSNLRLNEGKLPRIVLLNSDQQLEPLRYYSRVNDCVQIVSEIENLYIIPTHPSRH